LFRRESRREIRDEADEPAGEEEEDNPAIGPVPHYSGDSNDMDEDIDVLVAPLGHDHAENGTGSLPPAEAEDLLVDRNELPAD
jgi:hypothetical protein